MDFKDYCKQLADRVSNLKEQISTEEATKNSNSKYQFKLTDTSFLQKALDNL